MRFKIQFNVETTETSRDMLKMRLYHAIEQQDKADRRQGYGFLHTGVIEVVEDPYPGYLDATG